MEIFMDVMETITLIYYSASSRLNQYILNMFYERLQELSTSLCSEDHVFTRGNTAALEGF